MRITKVKPGYIYLLIGIIFAWLALYIILSDFYEGLVEATVSIVHGEDYRSNYLKGVRLSIWIIFIIISSYGLAIGLKSE